VNKPLVFWQTNISGKTKNKSTQIIHWCLRDHRVWK
jgi:hypothetical protein